MNKRMNYSWINLTSSTQTLHSSINKQRFHAQFKVDNKIFVTCQIANTTWRLLHQHYTLLINYNNSSQPGTPHLLLCSPLKLMKIPRFPESLFIFTQPVNSNKHFYYWISVSTNILKSCHLLDSSKHPQHRRGKWHTFNYQNQWETAAQRLLLTFLNDDWIFIKLLLAQLNRTVFPISDKTSTIFQ